MDGLMVLQVCAKKFICNISSWWLFDQALNYQLKKCVDQNGVYVEK